MQTAIASQPQVQPLRLAVHNWDTLHEGLTFESRGRTVTEADVVAFSGLSGDFNRIHTDREYARSTPYGERIAHGLLVLSILSGLTTQADGYRAIEPSIVAMRDIACRFPRPTLIGDTIFVRVTVLEKKDTGKVDRGDVTFRREAINQRGEVVAQADFRMILRKEGVVA
jgi:acyl dehydratase